MIDINKLLNAKRVVVECLDVNVDKEFVKKFREKNSLTQTALANIMGVTKKTIEKWEQGKNPIKGSSAVLLTLLNDDSELLNKVYSVKVYKESTNAEFNFEKETVNLKIDDFEQLEEVSVNWSACKTELCIV